MACKRRVVVRVCGVSCCSVEGFYHPRGCMGARYSHLDLEVSECLGVLLEACRVRGFSVSCVEEGDCVRLYSEVLPVDVVLCVDGASLRCSGGRVYVMRSRSGMVYVGGVVLG